MSEQIKEIKPFRQVPFCEGNAKLSITGAEFQAITNVLNIFKMSVDSVQSIMDRNINEGNITIKYITQDGDEISQDEATSYLKKASEYLKKAETEKTPN